MIGCINDDLNIVKQTIMTQSIEDINEGFKKALYHDNLALSQWIYEYENNVICTEEMFSLLCYKGLIKILKWLYSINFKNISLSICINMACITNNIELLKWLFSLNDNLEFTATNLNTLTINTNNTEILIFILNKYPNLKYQENIFTLLCEKGNLEILEWIITKIDYLTLDPYECFHTACVNNNLTIAKWLLSLYPEIYELDLTDTFTDIIQTDYFNIIVWMYTLNLNISIDINKIFRIACIYGNTCTLLWLLNIKPEIYESSQINDFFLLLCKNNNIDIIKLLLKNNQNVDFKKGLNIAWTNNSFSVCKYLQSLKPNIKIILRNNFNSFEPIKTLEMIKWYFTTYNITVTPTIFKQRYELDVYKYLLDLNPSLNKLKIIEDLFIINCCIYNNLQVAKWLFTLQPNINISKNNEYIFRTTCINNYLDVAKWLYEIKPNININIDNDIIFITSCGYHNDKLCKWLYSINKNINISAQNENAFINACKLNNINRVKWLLSIKPDINISINNNIAFFIACHYNIDIAKYIYSIKPDITLSFKYFKNACLQNNIDLVKWFLDINPNIDITCENDICFKFVCNNGYYPIALLLSNIIPTRYIINNHNLDNIDYKIIKLLNVKKTKCININSECPICYNKECEIITICNHQFCLNCIQELYYINSIHFNCPLCRITNNYKKIYKIKKIEK